MHDVLVVGAGPAGLSCARLLRANGLDVSVVEAADDIGGRLRTDQVEGFVLDRGFQVLQTGYPEAKRQLDYHSLDLHSFEPGALIRGQNTWYRFADPLRSPRHVWSALFSGAGSLGDKMRLFSLRRRLLRTSLSDLFKKPEQTMLEALGDEGFSEQIRERFFRPFFTAVFFDPELKTSSRMFEFVFRTFASGTAALPGRGIASIPRQLARSFPPDMVLLNSPVQAVEQGKVRLTSGREISAKTVVVACDSQEAARLLQRDTGRKYQSVRCVYFQAQEPPVQEPILMLNAQGVGPVTSLCVPSQVAPGYAPKDKALVSATVVGQEQIDDDQLIQAVRTQAEEWFGAQARDWKHIHTYNIHKALQVQDPPTPDPFRRQVRGGTGLYLAGDLGSVSSLQWALFSGRRAAKAVIEDFGLPAMSSNLTEGVFDAQEEPS
ncbi:MAG: NAD(P)/FAD-dependent oxidoreductase [Desulfovermiculus sp.]